MSPGPFRCLLKSLAELSTDLLLLGSLPPTLSASTSSGVKDMSVYTVVTTNETTAHIPILESAAGTQASRNRRSAGRVCREVPQLLPLPAEAFVLAQDAAFSGNFGVVRDVPYSAPYSLLTS